MNEIWVYALASVFIVSLISLIGVFLVGVKISKLKFFLIYLIAFSAGALFGDVFIHLLPESVEAHGFGLDISFYFLVGIIGFFLLEKAIHWQHCHTNVIDEKHIHPFAYTNLVGDGLHNLIDGLIIGASYIVSIPVGIATTIAILLHEIPQEIGDFAVLMHAGFSKGKALLVNFGSGLLAVIGALIALILSGSIENLEYFLIPIAAGGFVYIAGSDLIPELHKHSDKISRSLLQVLFFVLGVLVMASLLFLE